MSRRASRPRLSSGHVAACMLVVLMPVARAQTIADYSRAQRALLETTMTQAAARSAGMGAPTPAASAPLATSAPAPAPTPALHAPMQPSAPAVQVSGVFVSKAGSIAEVVVNATPYLVTVGQGVPGTAWQVEAIAVDRVVLARRGGVVAAADAQAAHRVFALPSLPAPH